LHFLYYARGSLFELETQILLSQQLQYISEAETADVKQLITPVAKSLTGLINSLDQQAAAATSLGGRRP
jgi:four helix bundle protein